MSHFYGRVTGNRGPATRCGSKVSGYHTVAASWDGAIEVRLSYDPKTDASHYVVYQSKWYGRGVEREISRGTVGEREIARGIVGKDDARLLEEAYDAGYQDAMGSR